MVPTSIPQVPSAFVLADCFLQLHRYYLNGKLFRPDRTKGETVLAFAAEEGTKAKKCIGALRYLWRNAQEGSHDRHVQDLKDLLSASPVQEANAQARVQAELEDAGEPASGHEPQDEASSEVEQADEEEMESDGGGSQGDSDDGGSQGDSNDGGSQGDSGHGGSQGDSADASSLIAPTLRLGDAISSSEAGSEDENAFVDSQVRPEGWLGGFYHKWKAAFDFQEFEDKVPPKNPHLFRCKEAMNSEAVAFAMGGVGISMSEEVVRELAEGLSDLYDSLLAQDETLAE